MANFNKHVGMSVEDCYMEYREIIHQIARKSRGALKDVYAMDIEDLYQIATIGFLNAYNEYKSIHNSSFATYAHNRIKWELYNTLKKRYSVHFPSTFVVIWNLVAKYRIGEHNLHEMEKHKPKNVSFSTVKVAMSWAGRTTPSSLDTPVSTETQGDKEQALYDIVTGSNADETTAIVLDFLSKLTEKQATIVALLLEDKKQAEIARVVDLNQSQVSRIIKTIQKQWLTYIEEAEA